MRQQDRRSTGPTRTQTQRVQPGSGNQVPTLALPTGGGAIKGISETFSANPITGTASFDIPLPIAPGRGYVAEMALTYDSGAGNSPFGLGWDVTLPSISRKTDKGLPQYLDSEESDVYMFSGVEDLVPVLTERNGVWEPWLETRFEDGVEYEIKRYRPRTEGGYARIERWRMLSPDASDIHWRVWSRTNQLSVFGRNPQSRIFDPEKPAYVFKWLIEYSCDDRGNRIEYEYKREDLVGVDLRQAHERHRASTKQANCYLKRVLYGNTVPYWQRPLTETDYLFQTVFDWGEHGEDDPQPNDAGAWTVRHDPYSSYRAGFEIRVYRRCRRVLLFHTFQELGSGPTLVRSLDLTYDEDPSGFSFLTHITQTGYVRRDAGGYEVASLPPMTFHYKEHVWQTDMEVVPASALEQLPGGVDGEEYRWIDLYGEGLSGILAEQAGALVYKRNLGEANFGPATVVAQQPNLSGLTQGNLQLTALEADGQLTLVSLSGPAQGYFALNEDESWERFRPFSSLPAIDYDDPNLRYIDLDGSGRPDLLITEERAMRWYPSAGEEGYGPARFSRRPLDDDGNPVVIFANQAESIFLADMSGDGLQDIVRIRNGHIAYWPNLGYGHFGVQIIMSDAPRLDTMDQFEPGRVRLADLDGSGTTDLIYLGRGEFRYWLNQSGNGWGSERVLPNPFPELTSATTLSVFDLLGTGTACLVWSSSLPQHANAPLRYVNLMGGIKPHVMSGYDNGMGKRVTLDYTPSTRFYLDDRARGEPWVSRLHFPVHCLTRIETLDEITGARFCTEYSYHHGYYDRAEREFRGFGRVDQIDTESFEHFSASGASNVVERSLHQPPVLIKTWFHTGAAGDYSQIHSQYLHEYYATPDFEPAPHMDPVLPVDLTDVEWREALRACRGLALRTEVYGLDGSVLEPHPYSIVEKRCQIERVQPQGENRHAVFQVIQSETLNYQLDRNPTDSRVTHHLTLETDEYGQVLTAAVVGYPRLVADASLPQEVRLAQSALSIVVTNTDFTGDIDRDDYPAPYDSNRNITVYRLRQPYEGRSWELHGLLFAGGYLSRQTLLDQFNAASETGYEAQPDGSLQKRLLQHGRTYYFKDDLTGSLPLGVLGGLGLICQTEQLAFTPELLAQLYGSRVAPEMMREGGYVHSNGDTSWWVPSETALYAPDAADSFYLASGTRDPFGHESIVSYDQYRLLVETTTDPLGNQTVALNDYRLLQPVALQDVNGNWSAVATDALGMVTRTALLGKLPTGENPLTAVASEGDTLANPSVELIYDLHNWLSNGAPNYVRTRAWEEHHAANPNRMKTQEKVEYSDGSGNVVMVKVQAEPGLAKRRLADGTIIEEDTTPGLRWIGNGRTILNNKGNPVKQYEPYFSVTADYEDDPQLVEIGHTAITFYDAIGRKVGRLLPNHTFEKVVLTPWRIENWDVHDTVLIENPADDPHVGAYIANLDAAAVLPGWYAARIGGDLGAEEARAAQLAAEHAGTPSVITTDALGRTIYAEADNGSLGVYTTRTELDIEGNMLSVVDDRGNTVMAYRYNLLPASGEDQKPALYMDSMDGGERWVLLNVTGQPLRSWDSRGHELRVEYDALQRPISSWLNENGAETLIGMTIYGESAPAPQADNLVGQIWQVYDQAGLSEQLRYDFKGNPVAAARTLTVGYADMIDWQSDPVTLLQGEVFESSVEYDALNRVVRSVSPHHANLPASEFVPSYNESGGLDRAEISVRGGPHQIYVRNITYDAKGQRQRIDYGNGVTTEYTYDPMTFRLIRMLSTRSRDGAVLQDLNYTYDAVGNITEIHDDAQQTIFFQNQRVEPHAQYRYDALYRLIEASGREHAGQAGTPGANQSWLPELHPNDGNAMRGYTQFYDYDGVGNILQMTHRAGGNGWSRHYQYANDSNRLLATTLNDPALPFDETYEYNAHGSMTRMPHLAEMKWDHAEQLREIDLGGGGTAYYVYDGGGKRVRKVHDHSGSTVEERIYLGGWEIYRKHTAGQLRLERETLHLMDDQRRIALIETKTVDAQSPGTTPQSLTRYQLGNHLGSAALELNAAGDIISYEEFHPYGTTAYHAGTGAVEDSPKRYRYTGKERDEETGFSYHGARYFSTGLSRWLNPDPAGLADGMNLYAYSKLRPTVMVDLSGLAGDDFSKMQAPQISDYYGPSHSMKAIQAGLNKAAAEQLKKTIDQRIRQGFFDELNAIAEHPLYGITSLKYQNKIWEGEQKGYIDTSPGVYADDNRYDQPEEESSGPLIEDPVETVLSFLPWTPMGWAIWILLVPNTAYGGVLPKLKPRVGTIGKVKGTGSSRSVMSRIGRTGQLEMFTGAGVVARYHRIFKQNPAYARFSMSASDKMHWAIDHGGRLVNGVWYVKVRDVGNRSKWIPAEMTNQYDLGHVAGVSHKHLVEFAERHNLSKEQWEYLVSDWNLYEPQTIRFNRGHHGDIDYLDIQRVISVLSSFPN